MALNNNIEQADPDDNGRGVQTEDGLDLIGDESRRLAAYWKDAIDDYNEAHRRWHKRGRTIEKRYRDERNRVDEEGQRRYNSLWANVEILHPALYGRVPTPIAERRFRDKDPAGRGAAQMLERGLRNEIEINGFGEAIDQAVMDYLLPGRGTVWVRYEPEVEESVSIPSDVEMDLRDARGPIGQDEEENESDEEKQEEQKLMSTGDRIARESVPIDYIQWTDFFTFPAKARTWKEVTAVGKRVFMTRDQMKRRFGDKIGKAVPLERDDRERRRQNETVFPEDEASERGQVYEIWNRGDEQVYWLAEGYDYLCDRLRDPMNLADFYPCPRPLYANRTNNTLVPVPDYMQYQDQAIQIDELTQRVSMLAKACKVAGVYNAAATGIKRLLDESVENELIPVDSWAAFAEKGGVAGQIALLPLKEVMEVIDKLSAVKEATMAEMNQLTGITDIMRGTSDARETMGGQRLKTNNSATRLQRRQNEVARFCRDTVRLMAEVMSIHFSPQSLIEVSGALFEEGLGLADMPPLDEIQNQMSGGSPPSSGQQPGGAAPASPGSPGPGPIPAPAAPAGAAGPPPNVVPFARPGAGAQALPGGPPPIGAAGPAAPPAGPAGPPGAMLAQQGPGQPGLPAVMGGPPPIPPEMLAQLKALQRIAAAIRLLRDEKLRGFRVDIEIDSTVVGDDEAEQARRTAFVTTVTGFLQQAMLIGSSVPEMVPLLGKFLQFAVRGFKVGRDLEVAIEDFCDEAEQKAKQRAANPQAAPPNPEMIRAQTEQMKQQSAQQITGMKIQADQQKLQGTLQIQGMKNQGEQAKAQAEVDRQAAESQGEVANSQADLQAKQVDREMKMMELEIEKLRLQADQQKWSFEMAKLQHEINNPRPVAAAGGQR